MIHWRGFIEKRRDQKKIDRKEIELGKDLDS